jgi:hypothetical protein
MHRTCAERERKREGEKANPPGDPTSVSASIRVSTTSSQEPTKAPPPGSTSARDFCSPALQLDAKSWLAASALAGVSSLSRYPLLFFKLRGENLMLVYTPHKTMLVHAHQKGDCICVQRRKETKARNAE